MVRCQLSKLLHIIIAPIFQHLLQIPTCNGTQQAMLGKGSVLFSHNDLPELWDTRGNGGLRTFLPNLLAQQFPPHRSRGHLEAKIPWVVHELQDSMRRIVTWPIPELVNARVPSRPPSVSLSEVSE